ncbi:hypothetical protein WR25_16657 [Diploscapter pachys]|uniref:Uncharacterized protein n=1 Tax=Diploscapter pachys TaxID=2018661 RepID=A0A2A2KDL3_9BILA|nr:hypothetical protein WR25_16657 [Diploscapter pachys]
MWVIACDQEKPDDVKKAEMKPLSEEMWIDLNGHPGNEQDKKDAIRKQLAGIIDIWIKQCNDENKRYSFENVSENIRVVNKYVRAVRHNPQFFAGPKDNYVKEVHNILNVLNDEELKTWWVLQKSDEEEVISINDN